MYSAAACRPKSIPVGHPTGSPRPAMKVGSKAMPKARHSRVSHHVAVIDAQCDCGTNDECTFLALEPPIGHSPIDVEDAAMVLQLVHRAWGALPRQIVG
jgi:hypothetical protein